MEQVSMAFLWIILTASLHIPIISGRAINFVDEEIIDGPQLKISGTSLFAHIPSYPIDHHKMDDVELIEPTISTVEIRPSKKLVPIGGMITKTKLKAMMEEERLKIHKMVKEEITNSSKTVDIFMKNVLNDSRLVQLIYNGTDMEEFLYNTLQIIQSAVSNETYSIRDKIDRIVADEKNNSHLPFFGTKNKELKQSVSEMVENYTASLNQEVEELTSDFEEIFQMFVNESKLEMALTVLTFLYDVVEPGMIDWSDGRGGNRHDSRGSSHLSRNSFTNHKKHSDDSPDYKPNSPDHKTNYLDRKPNSLDKKPTTPDGKPHSLDQKPNSPERKRNSADEKSIPSDHKSNSPNHKPKSLDQKPTSPDEKPNPANQKPYSPDHKPNSLDQKPYYPEQKPNSADQKPNLPDQEPYSPDNKQVSPDQKPNPPNQKPDSHKTKTQHEPTLPNNFPYPPAEDKPNPVHHRPQHPHHKAKPPNQHPNHHIPKSHKPKTKIFCAAKTLLCAMKGKCKKQC